MSHFYAFVAVGELNSDHDPVRILRSAHNLSDLLEHKTYDPAQTAFWARAKVGPSTGETEIVNQKTGKPESVAVCGMSH